MIDKVYLQVWVIKNFQLSNTYLSYEYYSLSKTRLTNLSILWILPYHHMSTITHHSTSTLKLITTTHSPTATRSPPHQFSLWLRPKGVNEARLRPDDGQVCVSQGSDRPQVSLLHGRKACLQQRLFREWFQS